MKPLELLGFDPALCCSTGVCGTEADSVLPRFFARGPAPSEQPA